MHVGLTGLYHRLFCALHICSVDDSVHAGENNMALIRPFPFLYPERRFIHLDWRAGFQTKDVSEAYHFICFSV
ncbi:hypothetical protein D3C80_2014700 [compost metagenome]